ncbi:hypothetical protein ACFL6Y_11885, partial [Elusimicrobiota bacterium]
FLKKESGRCIKRNIAKNVASNDSTQDYSPGQTFSRGKKLSAKPKSNRFKIKASASTHRVKLAFLFRF